MNSFAFNTVDVLDQSATLGLIVLKADETVEIDLRKLLPTSIALHVSRIESEPEVTSQALSKMKYRLTDSAKLFPDRTQFGCVAYACTSATSVIGQQEVASRIQQGCKTKFVTDPVTALVAACEHLGIQKLAILTPYVEDVSAALRSVLEQHKISTREFGSFNEADEARVARIDEDSIIKAATELVKDAEALFISCTNLRTLGVIEKLENLIGKPVLTSNQVLAWHMTTCADAAIYPDGFGQLFKPASL